MPNEIRGTTLILHRITRRHVKTLGIIVNELRSLIFPKFLKKLRPNQIWFSKHSLIYVILFENTIRGWVGVRNVNADTQSCTLEIVLTPIIWGTGVSTDVILLIEYIMHTYLRIKTIIVHINPDNGRAIRFFEKMDYIQQKEQHGRKVLLYRKQLK